MPLEIKELVIRAKISEQSASPAPQASGATPPATGSQAEIIAACVEQVLEILQDKKER